MNKNLSQRVLGLVDIKLDILIFIAFQTIGLLILFFLLPQLFLTLSGYLVGFTSMYNEHNKPR
jgi:uncharacterized membrane protein SpoIIM required for sporulation